MTIADSHTGRRLTARGAKTRARIVAAAADLMYVQGVGDTTLDDVLAASGVSKSQLYHHFDGKEPLVRAVIDHVGERVIERERDALGHVSTIAGLRRWRDALVQNNALRHGAYGCALGTLASEVSDQDDLGRLALSQLFSEWQELLARVLRRPSGQGHASGRGADRPTRDRPHGRPPGRIHAGPDRARCHTDGDLHRHGAGVHREPVCRLSWRWRHEIPERGPSP